MIRKVILLTSVGWIAFFIGVACGREIAHREPNRALAIEDPEIEPIHEEEDIALERPLPEELCICPSPEPTDE